MTPRKTVVKIWRKTMNVNFKNTVTALVLTLTMPMLANAAIKTSQVSENKISVSYSQYDLKTATGRAAVERQVRQAARRICGPVGYTQAGSVKKVIVNKACFDEAVENAMDSVNGHSISAR